MAIYKLPLDDELDADIIEWIASFPRNKKSEVVRHALRYYMTASKEQEQVFIIGNANVPVKEPQKATEPVKSEVKNETIPSLPPKKKRETKGLGKGIESLLDTNASEYGKEANVDLNDLK